MTKVSDIMTPEPITLKPDTEIAEAAKVLLDRRINGVPIVDDDGNLVGILCQSDLVTQQKKFPIPSVFTLLDCMIPLGSTKNFDREIQKIMASQVVDAMTPNPVTVSPDDTVEYVATLMVDKKFHTLPVVDGGELVGVIGKEDVLRTLMKE